MPLYRKYNLPLLAITILSLIGLVYWQALFLPFIQDDWGKLEFFMTGSTDAIWSSIFSVHGKFFFRPLADLYLYSMYEYFGSNPLPFHLVALSLHALNALLAGSIISSVTRDRLLGDLVAVIYVAAVAIHLDPLAWAVGIYDVGGAFFFFLGLWLFLRERFLSSAFAYLLGCLFKESLILLPVILIAHVFLMTPAGQIKTWMARRWPYALPFAIVMTVVALIKLMGASPLQFSDNHPYVIDVYGLHVIENIRLYLSWMTQSILPYLTIMRFSDTFILSAVVVLTGYVLIFVSVARTQSEHARIVSFLMIWIIVALLSVLFLPNHTYRYYATYSLPAYIALLLYLIQHAARLIHLPALYSRRLLVGIAIFAVAGSAVQATRIYAEALHQKTFLDGTNHLISRAASVELVRNGLAQWLPEVPETSTLIIDDIDLWAFNKDSGPRVWYRDPTLMVFARKDLVVREGSPFVSNPVKSQTEAYTGASGGDIALDPHRLFVFDVRARGLTPIHVADLLGTPQTAQ